MTTKKMTKADHANEAKKIVEAINTQESRSGRSSTFLMRLAKTHARLAGGEIKEAK